jgi:hypothetical protein
LPYIWTAVDGHAVLSEREIDCLAEMHRYLERHPNMPRVVDQNYPDLAKAYPLGLKTKTPRPNKIDWATYNARNSPEFYAIYRLIQSRSEQP